MMLDQGGQARGSAHSVEVRGPASRLAAVAWILEGRRHPPASPASDWRVIPDAHPHIVVAAFPSGRVRSTVVGARSRWLDVDQAARAWTVGIRLHPGTLPQLTGLSASDFLDAGAPIDGALGAPWAEVRSRLDEADSPHAALEMLLAVLDRIGMGADDPDWKVRGLMDLVEAAPGQRMGSAARRLGVAPRTLRDAAHAHIGMAPKLVQRVVRLQRALALCLADHALAGSAAAHRAGYCDHAHFIHDCQDLLGETPEAFRARGRTSGAADSYKTDLSQVG